MARFQLYVCLPEAYTFGSSLRDEMIPIGMFTVTTPTAHGSTIEMTGVDNMYKFDKPFDDVGLDFAAGQTLLAIINATCEYCGVPIGYPQDFDGYDIVIDTKPDNATCRQIVSWVAQIAGCNATISNTGALQFKWYDMSALVNIDGGSFTAIGEETVYMRTVIWDGAGGAYENTGWNIFYDRIPRTGKYKITRVFIEDIEDPNNFNAWMALSIGDTYDGGNYRYNGTNLIKKKVFAGDNIVNCEFDITKDNYKTYWVGVGQDNYVSPNASKFKATFYIEPVSYDDKDSLEGGTFDIERKYTSTIHWSYAGSHSSTGWWWWSKNFLNSILKPAATYKITKLVVSNVADPSHFNNAYWRIRKSVDGGTTWTELTRSTLTNGENIVDYDIEVETGDTVRYRIECGQEVGVDPDASEFDFDVYFRADETPYLDGDDVDGGDFLSPLSFHNLTAITGTSIGTDDIQFTGVLVANGDISEHYPADGWDYYAMQITDNPFVAGHEQSIAHSIFDKIRSLKFRPFTTSSIQDPTIEAGDPCVIYDVKGNNYPSIITNVKFKTGGMTELSCTAEPPAKQGSSYVSTSVYKAEKKQTDFNTKQAYFNEIANSALGYYTTEVVDPQTGATITYKHDKPTLEASQYVIKIAGTLIAISDDGGQTYNSGLDTTTATLLMNLVYAHGIVADWIKAGSLLLTGETDGMTFTAYNYFYFVYEQTVNNNNFVVLESFENAYSPVIDVISLTGTVTASLVKLTGGSSQTLETITLQLGENKFTTVLPANYSNAVYEVQFNTSSGSGVVTVKGYHYAVDIRPNIYQRLGSFCDMFVCDLLVQFLKVLGNITCGGLYCDYVNSKGNITLVDGSHYTYIYANNSSFLALDSDSHYVSWAGGSDRRLKENIRKVNTEYIEQFFDKVEPVRFNYKAERGNDYIGLIAQDLQEVLKLLGLKNDKLVFSMPDVGDNGGMLAIDYTNLIGHLIAGVKDLYNKVDQQQKEIDELRAMIEELQKK